ncbi:MAG: UDP-N-acetylmuramoyl-L-alanyl-D-glutamate--2,6-diaminopimelate ligase [Xanthomonadaceae bacterium]|nr:UDP-N-acetylmuramoyl-L-alanyl-D-glutamate--2,6-diaminopimelate ligase [Xanthomonadaceae bacterium]MDP2186130.1 UDP-N-acetylmuramoyl-L-alanyl-D-glutamate--2,6-diaminopimelate ligase [Xanthomonadales bacterium]MDZ4116182.1 UDP-N-acetylmuramoyl-L-alanyl-D-glutamate--2,6-diaminopimelate ligase [Xanthomonadaceae bacterium]MDZ4377636.1 UDP-N-acetylmuramoyl-L-alanyl-D-glutamate--2,6-diaminopimelate ligase [Xanthomonadaceae bacterium]
MNRSMPLHRLLAGFLDTPLADTAITGLCLDSRALCAGDAFFALPGGSGHGIAFAEQALANGAAAVLYEPPLPVALRAPQAAIAVTGLRAALGAIADRFHDRPSAAMTVIGITGTNGKTSTVQLIAQALHARGLVAGTIGTLGSGLHGALVAGERTTPDVLQVHRSLDDMRVQGASHVAMEVSSHALDQRRVDAVRFAVAVFTNLSRDHLDYHGDMASYGAAKGKLFATSGLACAVINLDDAFGLQLFASLAPTLQRIGTSSRGHADAAIAADGVVTGSEGITFRLRIGNDFALICSALIGRFNLDNLLAVAGVLHALGITAQAIAKALMQLQPVPGRMSRVGGGDKPLVVVDYAHTPDALQQALASAREHAAGRVICVFGCGGERDAGKRPQMAAVAEAAADQIIVTDDNPRAESGDAIVADIVAGLRDRSTALIQRDRARAIADAVAMAHPGDVVLIAGKGHESYQEIAGRRVPFDDMDVARSALGDAS